MIHFRRPSSSHVPPHPSQISTGTLRYLLAAIAPPQPEQNIDSPPGVVFIYDQKPCPAMPFRECPVSIMRGPRHARGGRPGVAGAAVPADGGCSCRAREVV